MKVVLDTNILLVSISSRSRYHQIFKAFLEERYSICVTTEILLEYGEMMNRFFSNEMVGYMYEMMENSANIELITRYFSFDLIKADPDDNKFVDCAIASNADFIVTNDGHFKILKDTPFPTVKTLTIDEFMDVLRLQQ